MASPVHVSILSPWQAMLISTLILSFAPILIWSQSTSPPSQSHSPSTHSPSTHSPSTHSPSTHSPSTHSPSTHSPSTHSPSTHSPSTHSPSQPQAPSYNGPNYSKLYITGQLNPVLCPSPTETATKHSCCDTNSIRPCCHGSYCFPNANRAMTSKTQSTPSASRGFGVSPTPPTESLQSSEPPHKISPSLGVKIGAGVGIGLGILILIALASAILWFRRRQKHSQRKITMDGLECGPKPSFEEASAKSSRLRSDVISPQDLSWLRDKRNISPVPLCGPRLTALNTTIPRTGDLKSSSASKLITDSVSSPGLLGDAHAAFRFLDQSAPMAVPATLANEARSPVSPEENPLSFFPNVPPSPEEILLPPNTMGQAHRSVDLDTLPLATKKSHEFFLPVPQHESKDASTPPPSTTSPSIIILDSSQSIAPKVRPSGVRAHLRDHHPQPLRSNSSASRPTLADLPNHREPSNIASSNPLRSDSTAGGPTTTTSGKDSLDAKDDSAATIQNFSRKIGSLHLRQARES